MGWCRLANLIKRADTSICEDKKPQQVGCDLLKITWGLGILDIRGQLHPQIHYCITQKPKSFQLKGRPLEVKLGTHAVWFWDGSSDSVLTNKDIGLGTCLELPVRSCIISALQKTFENQFLILYHITRDTNVPRLSPLNSTFLLQDIFLLYLSV